MHCVVKDLSMIDLFEDGALGFMFGSERAFSFFCMAENLCQELRPPRFSDLKMQKFGKWRSLYIFFSFVEILLSNG